MTVKGAIPTEPGLFVSLSNLFFRGEYGHVSTTNRTGWIGNWSSDWSVFT